VIVIIGAGLIGLAIAFELATRGASVRVLDARAPGKAASWAGAGMLAPYTEALVSRSFEELCVRSLALYPRFVESVRAAGGVDARLRLDGVLEAAYDDAQERRLRAHAEALAARGVAARFLERDETRFMEPALGPGVRGAAYSAAEGSVDNRRLGRALQAACSALGVRIDAPGGDVALEADARRVLGVQTRAGFAAAQTVINAAGAWAGIVDGVPAHVRVPVTPVKGQMLALAMPRGLVRRVTWVPGAYLVPRDDGRLLIGATVENAGFDVRVTAAGIRALLDAALAALPVLGDLAVAETWAGLRPGTPDGLPYIGATALTGYVVATGHYRNGILLAPATARGVADLVEGRPDGALAPFALERKDAPATVAKESA